MFSTWREVLRTLDVSVYIRLRDMGHELGLFAPYGEARDIFTVCHSSLQDMLHLFDKSSDAVIPDTL
jgi:hypothetical protein